MLDPNDVQDVEPKAASNPALEALMLEAQQAEQQHQADSQAAEAKQAQREADTLAADLADALAMAATVAQPALWWLTPAEFQQLWGEKVRAGIAASGAEIMRRHGLSMGGLITQYGPYLGLAFALGPSVVATVSSYKAAKARQLAAAPAAPGGGDGPAA